MIAWQDQDHKKARTLNLDREVIWEAYLVGKTRFNDRAIQIAGMVNLKLLLLFYARKP
jgi:hypothetical protein